MCGKDIVNVSREGVRSPFLLTIIAGEVEFFNGMASLGFDFCNAMDSMEAALSSVLSDR